MVRGSLGWYCLPPFPRSLPVAVPAARVAELTEPALCPQLPPEQRCCLLQLFSLQSSMGKNKNLKKFSDRFMLKPQEKILR